MRTALACLLAIPPAVLLALQRPADSPPRLEQEPPPQKKPRLDNYGDPLPEGAVARFGTVRLRGCGAVVFSPDGKYVVTAAGPDHSNIVFWDTKTGKEIRRLTCDRPIAKLCYSPDGKHLLAATAYAGNSVWDVVTHEKRFTFDANQATFTSDSRYLLGVVGTSENPAIHFFDTVTGKQVREVTLAAKTIHIYCSPDGKSVAYTPWLDDKVILFDLEKKVEQKQWRAAHNATLSFGPDGAYLAAAGQEGVRLWEVASGREVGKWEQGAYSAVVFSVDGRRLIWNGPARLIPGSNYLWTVDIGQALPHRVMLHYNGILHGSPAFSPNSQTLAVSTYAGAVGLPDLATGKDTLPITSHMEHVWTMVLSQDGRQLVTSDGRRQLVWNVATAKPLQGFADAVLEEELVLTTAVDSERVVTFCLADGILRVRHLLTGDELKRLEMPGGFYLYQPRTAAITEDGKWAAIFGGTEIAIFDLTKGKGLVLAKHKLPVWRIGSSGETRRLAVTLQDPVRGLIIVHVDPDTGEESEPIKVTTASFSKAGGRWPDRVWQTWVPNLQKMRLRDSNGKTAFADFKGTLHAVVESQGNRYVAALYSERPANETDAILNVVVSVWDEATGSPLDHIKLPEGQRLVCFSNDSRLLVSTSLQGTFHFWDLANGQERLHLPGHLHGRIATVIFTPNGRSLFSGGDDAQILQWDLTTRAPDSVWRTVNHDPQTRQALWATLAGTDTPAAHKAIWELAADPAGTVGFLETRLKPVAAPADGEIAKLIAELDSDNFAKRQAAQRKLTKIGDQAVPGLLEALSKPTSLEQRLRLQKLVKELGSPRLSGEALCSIRAVEVLERIATPEARRLLDNLAKGAAGSRFTREAKESLERLEKARN